MTSNVHAWPAGIVNGLVGSTGWTVRTGVGAAAATAGAATASARTRATAAAATPRASPTEVRSPRAIRFMPSLLSRPVIDRKGVMRGSLRGPMLCIGRPTQLGQGDALDWRADLAQGRS